MKITKSMLVSGAISTVALASLTGIGASAQTPSEYGSNRTSIVERIATKFGLNQDEVRTVFDEQHSEMEANREIKREEQLQTLVDDGTITEDQKTALQAKQEEMKAAKEALKDQNLTHEEMHEQIKQAKDEFKAWAEDQRIDLEAIRPEGGRGQGKHREMMRGLDN